MSHFLRENEYQRPQPQQHCIYGHGNKTGTATAIHKTRALHQQQEIDDDFDGTTYQTATATATIHNKPGNRKSTQKPTNSGSACDSGCAANTVKTATILVSKTKTKTGLPLLPKSSKN